MIDYITGTVTELNPAFAVVECNGIGYGINISLNTFSALEKDTSCRILIHRRSAKMPISCTVLQRQMSVTCSGSS